MRPPCRGPREGRAVKGSKGFTLAELLVVVAIIAILAGILFPVLRQAQDTARMRTCTSNLRELGQAFAMYLDDHNGFAIPGPATQDWYLMPDPLMKYVKQGPIEASEKKPNRVWICPGDRGFLNEPARWRFTGQCLSSYRYPYGAFLATTAHVDVASGTTRVNAPRRPDQWARPTRDVLLCDWSPNFHKGRKDVTVASNNGDSIKCINFLMLDGHVTVGTRREMLSGYINYSVYYDNPYSTVYNPIMVLK